MIDTTQPIIVIAPDQANPGHVMVAYGQTWTSIAMDWPPSPPDVKGGLAWALTKVIRDAQDAAG